MSCFDNIIGLTRRDCECFEDNRPDDYNVSKSGLYLDELEGISLKGINRQGECGDHNIWTKLQQSVQSGINTVETEVLACLQNKTESRRKEYQGVIGGKAYTDVTSTNKAKVGLKIKTYNVDGGNIIIDKIDAYFSGTGTITANIYSSVNNEQVATFDFDTVGYAKTTTTLSTPIELPLYEQYETDLYYYILIDFDANNKPLNNKLDCGCGGNKPNYFQWIDINGVESSSDLLTQTTSNYTYGMNLKVRIKCNQEDMICKDGDELDYTDANVKILAEVVRLASSEHLLMNMGDVDLNKYTTLSKEERIHFLNVYRHERADKSMYLCDHLEVDNDCFKCKRNITRGQILV